MTPDPKSVMLWVAGMVAIGTVLLLLPARRSEWPSVVDPPWIGLPQSGMDASRAPLRELLVAAPGNMRPLSSGCGMRDDMNRERYRLSISRNAWKDFREIEFVPDGEWLDVAILDGFPPPPPEPPRSGVRAEEDEVLVQPVVRARLRRRDAEPIRRAWNTPGLWHAEQKPLGCMDGRPVTLEACIDGRYAIRHRNCDVEAYAPAQALWNAVNRLLPAPEPAYWLTR